MEKLGKMSNNFPNLTSSVQFPEPHILEMKKSLLQVVVYPLNICFVHIYVCKFYEHKPAYRYINTK